MNTHPTLSTLELPGRTLASTLGWLCSPSTCHLFEACIDAFDHTPLPDTTLPMALAKASPKRKRKFIAGRYCTMRALQEAGHPVAAVDINENGLPSWPAGWTDSINHCSVLALALVDPLAACRGIGIDIEGWIDSAVYIDIAGQVARPRELAQLHGHSSDRDLSILFSAKETLYKALFPQVGHFYDFSAARVRRATSQWLELELCEDWSRQWQCGQVLRVHYVCMQRHVMTALYIPLAVRDT